MGYIGRDKAYYDTYNEVRKADAIFEQREKQNKLLEEQNNLLKQNQNNYNYNYANTDYFDTNYCSTNGDTTFLGLLSILSIIPVALGFILLFLVPHNEGKELGIKVFLGGLVAPTLNLVVNLIKKYSKKKEDI